MRLTYLFVEPNRKRDKDNVAGFAHKVVQDGMVMDSSLKRLGLGRQWLDKILSENSVDPTDIFMMTAETAAKYRIIKKELSTECREDKIIEKG